ncbi:MAG: DNA polymerase IV [Erysipelotrichaceae bacterium]|jgi:DNA polymerase-4
MERVILHCDLNSFYASVEELYHPEVKGKPVVVGGSEDERHGIVLARNQIAKKYNIVTAETIWQAKRKCPDLIILKPNHKRYEEFSLKVREIFLQYTDLVEPFGIDEAWLDVTNSKYFGTGKEIADEIREKIKSQLGITASVGISFNKVFAKLGSDLRKPDYTTVITKENYKELVWPLKANEMIYIGKSSYEQLKIYGLYTIGDVANKDVNFLKEKFGKWGEMIWVFANGLDDSEVTRFDHLQEAKSIGNNITTFRNMENWQDVDIILNILAESVATTLRQRGLMTKEVSVYFRDSQLKSFTRQMQLDDYTNLSSIILKTAKEICRKNYRFQKPLRTLGIRVRKFIEQSEHVQLSLFEDVEQIKQQEKLETAIDDIRSRYGHKSIKKLSMLVDQDLSDYNPVGENDNLTDVEEFR